MNKETRNLVMFFLATFVATWATYCTIVFNGWDPYSMPGIQYRIVVHDVPDPLYL